MTIKYESYPHPNVVLYPDTIILRAVADTQFGKCDHVVFVKKSEDTSNGRHLFQNEAAAAIRRYVESKGRAS